MTSGGALSKFRTLVDPSGAKGDVATVLAREHDDLASTLSVESPGTIIVERPRAASR
jgi:hypothetical protein